MPVPNTQADSTHPLTTKNQKANTKKNYHRLNPKLYIKNRSLIEQQTTKIKPN